MDIFERIKRWFLKLVWGRSPQLGEECNVRFQECSPQNDSFCGFRFEEKGRYFTEDKVRGMLSFATRNVLHCQARGLPEASCASCNYHSCTCVSAPQQKGGGFKSSSGTSCRTVANCGTARFQGAFNKLVVQLDFLCTPPSQQTTEPATWRPKLVWKYSLEYSNTES